MKRIIFSILMVLALASSGFAQDGFPPAPPVTNITGITDSTSTTSSTVAASATAAKAAYDLANGKQTANSNLTALAGLTGAASKMFYFTAAGTLALIDAPTQQGMVLVSGASPYAPYWGNSLSFRSLALNSAVTSTPWPVNTAIPLNYTFTVTAANATQGATYTNNGVTYTVSATIAGTTTLVTTGISAPEASGTLTKASGTGDATITFSSVSAAVSQGRAVYHTSDYLMIQGASALQYFYPSISATKPREKIASFAWDGGGSAVATAGSKRCTLIPTAFTVTGYSMVIDQDPGAGTTILNLDKDAIGDGTALATTDMDGAAHAYPPTVADNKVSTNDTTITGWTTAVAVNDMICATVATNAVATWISLTIYGTRN